MTPERLQKIEQLFHDAAALPATERIRFLTQACDGDEDLRAEVLSLLSAAPEQSGFLQSIVAGAECLPAGGRIGPYEIESLLGEGGMGQVYKARDTRLDRTVALKVLPAHTAADAGQHTRLLNEARAASALNHPNIVTVHDVVREGGRDALVMEYVAGRTLQQRIGRNGLPLKEALHFAIQIAGAVAAAHDAGIIHRDLKPGNIIISEDGTVKVLDFGLAKQISPGPRDQSATLTVVGTIAGTIAYMSPEQTEGKPLDARSDVFSFGAVLYEMLSGRQAFRGRTAAETFAAIQHQEPAPLHGIPPELGQLLARSLRKDPVRRTRHLDEARLILEDLAEGRTSVARPQTAGRKNRHWLGWIASAVLLAALGVLSWIHFTQPRANTSVTRFLIPQPEDIAYVQFLPPFLSPDGSMIAFIGGDPRGHQSVWLRRMGSVDAQPVAGTEGASLAFWSPDSKYLGFLADGKMLKISVSGGPPVALASTPPGLGASWSPQGVIVLATGLNFPHFRMVSASGGDVKFLRSPDTARQEIGMTWPSFLPDGRHFLFFSANIDSAKSAIRIGSLDSPQTQPLVTGAGPAVYVPEGYVLFTRQSTVFALPFDARRLQASGEAVPLTQGVGSLSSAGAAFTASQTGVLAYRDAPTSNSQLTWYDQSGNRRSAGAEAGAFRQAALSPDGKKVVLERLDTTTSTFDIWVLDLSSLILQRLTNDPADDTDPVWSPDSRQIAFASLRGRAMDIYRREIGASKDELVYSDAERKVPEWWLKDGRILYTTDRGTGLHLVASEGGGKPEDIFHSDVRTDEPSVSPDGRWVAFNSMDSGRWEVYIAAFPSFADKRQVSNGGAGQARWRADGKELYYLSVDGDMMAVSLTASQKLEPSPPRKLFSTHVHVNAVWDQYGVTADGKRFLALDVMNERPAPIHVVQNWPALLPGSVR